MSDPKGKPTDKNEIPLNIPDTTEYVKKHNDNDKESDIAKRNR